MLKKETITWIIVQNNFQEVSGLDARGGTRKYVWHLLPGCCITGVDRSVPVARAHPSGGGRPGAAPTTN